MNRLPPHWNCQTHGRFNAMRVVGCPECVIALRQALALRQSYDPLWRSAIECLREIADMGKVGSETAKNWLITHNLARVDGGYVPGRGFEENPFLSRALP